MFCRSKLRALAPVIPILISAADLAVAQSSDVGSLSFPTSVGPEAQAHFVRGVAALHNFWYAEALDEFRQAQELEPDFAMAYWGEAIAQHRPFSFGDRLEEIQAVLGRLGATEGERLAKAQTERERDYLEAAHALICEGDKEARYHAYAEAMERVANRYPEDDEAQMFFALSLFGTTELTRRDRAVMERLAGICERILDRNPEHPGAIHYRIHALDTPEAAYRTLDGARVYARIAPASPHALHMPAHIFVQLGMWDEAIASNEAAYRISAEWVEREGRSLEEREYHAFSWLPYARVQKGQYEAARETLDQMEQLVAETGSGNLKWYYAEMTAHYLVSTQRWTNEAFPRSGFDGRAELLAIGMNAAMTGDMLMAREMLGKLSAAAERATERGGENAVSTLRWGIAEAELRAILRMKEGESEIAIASMTEALALQARLAPPNELPDPVKPANELFGEILLEQGRLEEAAEQFDIALARRAGRASAMLGRARAAVALGDAESARSFYEAILEQLREADSDLEILSEARDFLSETAGR